MKEFLSQPWPWYIGGVLIGIMVPVLLMLGNKQFGVSSSMRHICAACIPGDIEYFNYDWKSQSWNLFLVAGIIIGGIIGGTLLENPNDIAIAESTRAALSGLGLSDFTSYIPKEIFSWENIFTGKGFFLMIVGGFLIGFGTRYANGCTSGHAITGLSLLNLGSLVATICFFIGGLIMTHVIFPLIF